MKIKIIATGSSKWERFIHRWGVSFLIGEDVLFDTFGDPCVLLNNMRKFKVDATKIKHIVLSHDDWDHISGLWYLLNKREDVTVYICPGFDRAIKMRIASFGVKIVEAGGLVQIKDDIYTTGELSGESKGRKIYEQSVVVKTNNGLTIICGCAHPGVVDIVGCVKESFQENIYALIGGFHLKYDTVEKINSIITCLRTFNIKRIVPMHCTGKLATRTFRQELGDAVILIKQGSVLEV